MIEIDTEFKPKMSPKEGQEHSKRGNQKMKRKLGGCDSVAGLHRAARKGGGVPKNKEPRPTGTKDFRLQASGFRPSAMTF